MANQPIPTTTVSSVTDFIHRVLEDANDWLPVFPWFRGEPADAPTPLTPPVFRPARVGFHHDENNLLQTFRRRAHLLNIPVIPNRDATDEWLFLARHMGLPTRLLDWTEGAVIALYFALLLDQQPVVWMLNPWELNRKADPAVLPNVHPLTWVGIDNPANRNIQAAWSLGGGAAALPVAIEPTNVHPRMNAQHSYFTVHGNDRRPLSEQVGGECLRLYQVQIADHNAALSELRMLGVADSTIMPDAEALSRELERFLVVRDG